MTFESNCSGEQLFEWGRPIKDGRRLLWEDQENEGYPLDAFSSSLAVRCQLGQLRSEEEKNATA